MAKKDSSQDAELEFALSIAQPKLKKLIIKNFRCIGNNPVEIDLDNIVVLVGPNNVGKSTILEAYELVMKEGQNGAKLTLDDFPGREVKPDALPEIHLHSFVDDAGVGDDWLETSEEGFIVKEQWKWRDVNVPPERRGWDVKAKDWHPTKRPFGFPAIANLRRPEPHPVKAFDTPDIQTKQIKDLLLSAIKERIEALKNAEGETVYSSLVAEFEKLQNQVLEETKTQAETASEQLSHLISEIFPKYKINLVPKFSQELDLKTIAPTADLTMGPTGGYMSPVEKQGSGARRTMLWTAIRFISETKPPVKGQEKANRPKLLLLDEPEICLHPNAIREASKVLYDLSSKGNWQVMTTTHSPVFLDFSRDNTTIVRVEKTTAGDVQTTSVFRSENVKLDPEDQANLKLLNLCDPYVAEFLFGGKVVIVEGDTEFTAFNYIKNQKPENYRDLHIIRARGKATIVSLMKVLNQFKSNYSVLHDSDSLKSKNGGANPAWTTNQKIIDEAARKHDGSNVRVLASLPNFEQAYFGVEILKDKPYNALRNLSTDTDKFVKVESLLNALVDHSCPVPDGCIEWSSLSDLENALPKLNTEQ